MASASPDVEEQLRTLDIKIGMLKREYEQYFLGTRPREPSMLRGEVQKIVVILTNTAFNNTALKFRFSSLCSRYQALRRQWDENLRKIEAGTYERHRFKAALRKPGAGAHASANPDAVSQQSDDLFQNYMDTRLACGQDVKAISREKLESVINKQRAKLREKFGDDSGFSFKVAVKDGRATLKAIRS